MFLPNKSLNQNRANAGPNTSLPNNQGVIRTLKEDFENFQASKSADVEPAPSPPPAVQINPTLETPPPAPPAHEPQPVPPPKSRLQAMPEAGPPREMKSAPKENVPTPLGTDSYYSGKSPFEELEQASQKSKAGAAGAPPKKSSGKFLTVTLSLLLVLAIIGGGLYYYWFYMKTPAPAEPQVPAAASEQPAQAQPAPENNNVRTFTADPAAGAAEFQSAFQKSAADFISGASENDLIELRPVGQDGQQILLEDFLTLFSVTLPEEITQSFSGNDYGLFVKKENGEARTGLVFKLTDPTGLSEKLSQQEENLLSEVVSLYLAPLPSGVEPAFNSSQYKSADIRYYNFPSSSNTSLDYSVVAGGDTGYLIFGNSKNTIRSILDYMSEK